VNRPEKPGPGAVPGEDAATAIGPRGQPPVLEVSLPGAHVVFSTRRGGVSAGPYQSLNLGILTDDDRDRVSENRRRLAAAAGLEPGAVAMGWQVHGADVREWEGPPERGVDAFGSPGAELPRVDAHTTTVPGLGLVVLVADCLPVALASPHRIALLHCGWRGLAAGIVERAVAGFEGPPVAAIGPGIGACCYEVGPEVLERFSDLHGVTHGRRLDLRAIAHRKLEAAGVEEIEDVDLCTSCRPDLFFSHRRDQGVTGRQAGLIVRA
jgi:purine-nucleoside/S-methyl-5'-thioadenosine phosphorylase / adenosine deaminase